MKLRRLSARNFGHFTQLRPLEFRTGGLQIVYGLNEAGKSTLLALLRGMLFEFEKHDPYVQEGFAGQLQAELNDGRQVELVRKREKRKFLLEATINGEPRAWTQTELNRLWGGVTAETFRQTYAFGLEEYLQSAGLVGPQAGVGGGLVGGFEPQQLLTALEKEAAGLFTPQARVLKFNQIKRRLDELNKQVRAAQLTAGRYDELQQKVASAEAAAGLARQRLQDAELRYNSAQAFERWRTAERDREACATQSSKLRVPPGLPIDAAEQFQRELNARQQLQAQLLQRQQANSQDQQELDGLGGPSGLSDLGSQMAVLVTRVEALASARRDLPEREAELSALRAQLQQQLRQLGLPWTAEDVAAFLPDLAQRQAYEELARRWQANDRALDLAAQRQADAHARQADCERDLAALGPIPNTEEIATFLERQSEIESALRQLQDVELRRAKLRVAGTELARELTPPGPSDLTAIAQLPAPPVEEIERWVAEETDLDECCRAARQEAERLSRSVEKQRRDLQAASPGGQVLPTREELARQRTERDRLFAEWARAPQADDELAARVAAAVAQADATADRLFENAAVVAKAEQLVEQERELAATQQRAQSAAEAAADFERRWRDYWSPCAFEPRAPAAMRTWRRQLTALREQLAAAADCEPESERLLTVLTEAAAEGRRLWRSHGSADEPVGAAVNVRADLPRLLAWAAKAVRQAEALLGKRQDLLQQQEHAERETRAAQDEQTKLQTEQADLAARWTETLARWRLPTGSTLEFVQVALNEIKHAQGTLKSCAELERRIRQMQAALADAESQVRPLCAEHAPDLSELPVEIAIRQLQARCKEAQAQAERRGQLLRNLRQRAEELPGLQSQLEETGRRISAWIQRGEARDEEEFAAVARQSPQAAKLREQASLLEAQGAVHQQQAGALAQDAAWLACSAEELHRRIAEYQQECADLKQRYDAAQQEFGRAQEEFNACQQEHGAAQTQAELESAHADLAELVERYAPLKLAHGLLDRFLQRFAREGQAELLASAGDFFRRLTSGKYQGLECDLRSNGDEVHAARHDGRTMPKGQLSTGTQEQMYLANRLAYATQLNSVQEPLPIILDDVLANFDADRARAALFVLHELARTHQVLFFTCHAHIVDLAQEVRVESGRDVDLLRLGHAAQPAQAATLD